MGKGREELHLIGSHQAWLILNIRELLECLLIDGCHIQNVGIRAICRLVLDGAQNRPDEESAQNGFGAHTRAHLRRLGTRKYLLADPAAARPRKLLLLLQETVKGTRPVLQDAVNNRSVERGHVAPRAFDGEKVFHVAESKDGFTIIGVELCQVLIVPTRLLTNGIAFVRE